MTRPTVRDIAAQSPAALSVFEKYKIDYCCGGHRPLAEACGERGVSPETVLAEVEEGSYRPAPERNWGAASLRELIGHIVRRHHGYLNTELPVLAARLAKVVEAHGPRHSQTLGPLESTFSALKGELEMHLRKEETVLFPAIEEMETAGAEPLCGTLRNPIRMMEYEHESAGQALRTMRQLTADYAAPADACITFRALYAGLEELEKDLHTHIHLENNILFPRAAEMENNRAVQAERASADRVSAERVSAGE
jgi:regulator of cell morphogenesis and NO signaling